MVDTDNAKSKRVFKKLFKNMGDMLDKEKDRYILLPTSSPSPNPNLIFQCDQNARPGRIKRMRFTFSVDTPPGPFPATSGLPLPLLPPLRLNKPRTSL
jgi:hypothetical protein